MRVTTASQRLSLLGTYEDTMDSLMNELILDTMHIRSLDLGVRDALGQD
jgi:hypothetical protein